MNAPIFSFRVDSYNMSLVIKGFENGDYNTKRVKFQLVRRLSVGGQATEEVVRIIKYPYPHPIEICEKGQYTVVPVSGKLSVLQRQFSFSAKRSTDIPRYVEKYLEKDKPIKPKKKRVVK